MPNYIRVKQINPNELSGFFVDSISSESGLLIDFAEQAAANAFSTGIVLLTGNQNISGNKTFLNNLNVSGDLTVAGTIRYNEVIDITTTGNISGYTGYFQDLYANNLVYNTGNQNISGQKRFVDEDVYISFSSTSLNEPSTFVGGYSGPGTYRFISRQDYRPYVFPNPQHYYSGLNTSPHVEIYYNTGTSRWWFTYNNILQDASPIVPPSQAARLPLTNWSGGNMRIYPIYSHSISHYTDGKDPIDPNLIRAVALTGNQTISGIKTFVNNQIFSGNINVSNTGIFNALDLNNIDNLSLSGVDITITSGNVILTNPISAPNLVYNTGNQTISGIKTFANSGVFSLSGASPLGLPNNPLSVVGSGNTYLQINIQNRATGTTATADLVITANNGTDTSNYINLGINNSGYNDPAFSNGSGLDGYLFINGGNLDIGTQTTGTSIEFHAGGTTAANIIARINSSGLTIVSGNLIARNTADQFPASTGIKRYPPQGLVTVGSTVIQSGQFQYFPFLIKKDAVNPKICVEVTAVNTATPIRYGIYSGNNGLEGARLFFSGSINCANALGIYTGDINTTLIKGPYIIATANTGLGTASVCSFRTMSVNSTREHFGDATGNSTLFGATFGTTTHYYETGIDLPTIIGSPLAVAASPSPLPALIY